MISADATPHASERRLIVVHLGDYIDRGEQSSDVIEMLSNPVLPGFETVFLKGNHEQLMLDYLDGGDGGTWFHNGGDATAQSYGVALLEDDLWGDGPTNTRAALACIIPEKHIKFLRDLEPWARHGDYAFVHAGISPGISLERQNERDLLWIRERFLSATDDHGMVVVHGHSISRTVDIQPNRIGIDTGAFSSGVLTALMLQDEDRSFLQTTPSV